MNLLGVFLFDLPDLSWTLSISPPELFRAVTTGYVTLVSKDDRRVDDLLARRSSRGVKVRRVISTRMHVALFTSLTELRVWHNVQTSYYVDDTRHVFRTCKAAH